MILLAEYDGCTLAKYGRMIDELKAEHERQLAEALALHRGEMERIFPFVHRLGIFSDKDPSVPPDLFDRHGQVVSRLRMYAGSVARKFDGMTELRFHTYLQRFTSHVAPGQQFAVERMPVPFGDVPQCRAHRVDVSGSVFAL